MNWKDLRPQIEKADRQIKMHKGDHTEFYKRQIMYWNGFKHGIGLAYKILKAKRDDTSCNTEALNIHIVSGSIIGKQIKHHGILQTITDVHESGKWVMTDKSIPNGVKLTWDSVELLF